MLRRNFKHCLTWKRKRFGCIKSSQIMLIFVPLHILSMRWTWSTTLPRCIQQHDLLTGRKRRKTRAMQHAKLGSKDFTQNSWKTAPLLTAVNFWVFWVKFYVHENLKTLKHTFGKNTKGFAFKKRILTSFTASTSLVSRLSTTGKRSLGRQRFDEFLMSLTLTPFNILRKCRCVPPFF